MGWGCARSHASGTRAEVAKKVAAKKPKRSEKKKSAEKRYKFTLDCAQPVADGIMDTAALEKYLHDHIKVDGKKGNLGSRVVIARLADRITVSATSSDKPFSKRSIKYLVKKYLRKNDLRNWLRVVATNKTTYTLKYYLIDDAAGEEEEK